MTNAELLEGTIRGQRRLDFISEKLGLKEMVYSDMSLQILTEMSHKPLFVCSSELISAATLLIIDTHKQ